jgi:hypothetical protein
MHWVQEAKVQFKKHYHMIIFWFQLKYKGIKQSYKTQNHYDKNMAITTDVNHNCGYRVSIYDTAEY